MSFLALSTPDANPWARRTHPESGDDPRGNYQRDRDRILHCDSFRKLQHKTQVFVVQEGDFFRTRLTHSLEVAQIGRTLAHMLNLTEPLVEAICLGHDLGHAPFGHAGEQELQRLLRQHGREWNANAHSLSAVEELELQYCEYHGLNLTWAMREGLARHRTRYDTPAETGEYAVYRQPSLEAQVANVADLIAYSTHDVEDALVAGLLQIDDLEKAQIAIWEAGWHKARDEFAKAHPTGIWSGVDKSLLLSKRARRHLIDYLIRDVSIETEDRVRKYGVKTLEEARGLEYMLVAFSPGVAAQVEKLLDFMMEKVYRGPIIARQNYRASHILSRLFEALSKNHTLLPTWVQERIQGGSEPCLEVARFLARLTDRSAVDLYAELFEPGERAMGHRILQ